MSSFGAKRKPRVIQTLDDQDAELEPSLIGGEEAKKEVPVPQGPIKFGRSKPAKSSSLRKSINIQDLDALDQSGPGSGTSTGADEEERDAGVSVVIRPAISRTSSLKQKKRVSSSRLSFGPSDLGGNGDAAGNEAVTTPKKTLGKRVVENNAMRRSVGSSAALPTRFGGFGEDEEGPKYSKEYLQELQSSTPNTPQNLTSLRITDDAEDGDGTGLSKDDVMDLDPSELDGALIVQFQDLSRRSPSAQALSRTADTAHILTEGEIRERKERRARLAQETQFIPLSDSDNSDSDYRQPSNRVTVRFDNDKPKKSESRLIAEDEDLGEGYDEFVSDGGLALGRKAEREAARRHRLEVAEMIQAAEEGSDAESDDSEAERRAAYETAQRRAGMDGLHKPGGDDYNDLGLDLDGAGGGVNMIPKMKPLPELDEVLQRMRDMVKGLGDEVGRKRSRIADLEREKGEILAREVEVQEILNQAGQKYQAVLGADTAAGAPGTPGAVSAVPPGISGEAIKLAVGQSPLRGPPVLPPGIAIPPLGTDLPIERGLESFGTTPTSRPDPDGGEEDKDVDMS